MRPGRGRVSVKVVGMVGLAEMREVGVLSEESEGVDVEAELDMVEEGLKTRRFGMIGGWREGGWLSVKWARKRGQIGRWA